MLAEVLQRSEKPLMVLTDGVLRPRFYSPLISPRNVIGTITECDVTAGYDGRRHAIRWLKARAMLRLHDGDVSGAWRDIMTMYRLARLGSQGSSIADWIAMGVTFDDMASEAAVVFSQHEGLTAAQARGCQRQLRGLPPMRSVGEICGEEERCSSLESLVMLAGAGGAESYFQIDAMLENMGKVMDPQRKTDEPGRKKREEAFKRLVAARVWIGARYSGSTMPSGTVWRTLAVVRLPPEPLHCWLIWRRRPGARRIAPPIACFRRTKPPSGARTHGSKPDKSPGWLSCLNRCTTGRR